MAVEIISITDTPKELQDKVEEVFSIFPDARMLEVIETRCVDDIKQYIAYIDCEHLVCILCYDELVGYVKINQFDIYDFKIFGKFGVIDRMMEKASEDEGTMH